MSDYAAPLRDIRFVLEHLVDLSSVVDLPGFDGVDLDGVQSILEEYARFIEDVVAPLNRVGDVEGSRHNGDGTVTTPEGFKAAYAGYVDAGWGAVGFPPEYGGGGFPWLVSTALQEVITSANMAFSMCPLLNQGAIDMLLHHASEELRETFVPKMVAGEWTGTMNLTEPQAGSDVGALSTRAVPQADGSYRISGTKIFITFGEHDLATNIIHLVLARTPDAPPGTKGISCFIVPKVLVREDGELGDRNDLQCVGIEHKMGINASPTCTMSFGDAGDGAVGYLIGEENAGMRYMFTMMNSARLWVGVEGLALAERAFQMARAFANERRQGRAPGRPAGEQSLIVDHPDVRRMLLTQKACIEALRGVILANAAAIDRAQRHDDETVRQGCGELVDLLTPVSKGWGTDLGVELTSLALQVFGGMGYIEETGIAQLYRDARIAPIYEGTNGIQAMDLVGRKLPMRDGGAVGDYLGYVDTTLGELAKDDRLASIHDALASALDVLRSSTNWLLDRRGEDPSDVLAGATPYLRMFSLVTGGWVMAQQALAATAQLDAAKDDDQSFFEDKLVTARFFCEQLLPQAAGLAPAVTATNRDLAAATL